MSQISCRARVLRELFGTIIGSAARPALRRVDAVRHGTSRLGASGLPTEAVLVVSPHAGNSRGLGRARRVLERHGIVIADELDIQAIDRLPELLRSAAGEARMVIAAGGDGTVGSVAGRLAGADNILGVLPLGTGNDFARSLDIPLNPGRAAEQLAVGEASSVDLGRVTRDGEPPAYFIHSASVGLNVDFAKLATRASLRARLGRLTYLAATAYAIREQASFTCTLEHEGVVEDLALRQLTVISAPVIGGSLGLSIRSPYRDDHGLDVLAIGNVAPWTLFRAGVFLLLGVKRPVAGVLSMHVDNIGVGSRNPLTLALDGELDGTLPGRLETLPSALRVVTRARRSHTRT